MTTMRWVVERGVAELWWLHVVVANAGICIPKPWDKVTPKIFTDHLHTDVTGVWNTVMVSAP